MGAVKRFTEEVSVIIGDNGEITNRTLLIAEKIMKNISKVKKPYTENNPEFVKKVKEAAEL